jgi:hypothetical protein
MDLSQVCNHAAPEIQHLHELIAPCRHLTSKHKNKLPSALMITGPAQGFALDAHWISHPQPAALSSVMILLAIATDPYGTVGGGTAPELEEATSGSTGPDIGLPIVVVGSTVIEAAGSSGVATPGTASGVAGDAGNVHAQSASTSCVSCLPVMTTKLASTIQKRQSNPPCD